MKICPECGTKINQESKMCIECMNRFDDCQNESIEDLIETAKKAVKSGDKNKMQGVYQKILFNWTGDNFGEAVPVLEIIARAGNVDAQVFLGTRYSKGIGVQLDYDKSAYWLYKAAEAGNKDALQILSDFYNYGHIGKTNPLYLLTKNNEKKAAEWKEKGEKKPVQVVCDSGSCMYSYTVEKGDPDHGIPPGTDFENLPEDWVCPLCGKRDFIFIMG